MQFLLPNAFAEYAGDPIQSRPGDGGLGKEYGGMVVVLGGRIS
jgi:hypothetical protein